MGATRSNAWSVGVVRLALVSLVVTVPVSRMFTAQWLDTFAYRTALNPGLIFLVCALSMVLVIGSVAYRSIAIARMNPIVSLRQD